MSNRRGNNNTQQNNTQQNKQRDLIALVRAVKPNWDKDEIDQFCSKNSWDANKIQEALDEVFDSYTAKHDDNPWETVGQSTKPSTAAGSSEGRRGGKETGNTNATRGARNNNTNSAQTRSRREAGTGSDSTSKNTSNAAVKKDKTAAVDSTTDSEGKSDSATSASDVEGKESSKPQRYASKSEGQRDGKDRRTNNNNTTRDNKGQKSDRRQQQQPEAPKVVAPPVPKWSERVGSKAVEVLKKAAAPATTPAPEPTPAASTETPAVPEVEAQPEPEFEEPTSQSATQAAPSARGVWGLRLSQGLTGVGAGSVPKEDPAIAAAKLAEEQAARERQQAEEAEAARAAEEAAERERARLAQIEEEERKAAATKQAILAAEAAHKQALAGQKLAANELQARSEELNEITKAESQLHAASAAAREAESRAAAQPAVVFPNGLANTAAAGISFGYVPPAPAASAAQVNTAAAAAPAPTAATIPSAAASSAAVSTGAAQVHMTSPVPPTIPTTNAAGYQQAPVTGGFIDPQQQQEMYASGYGYEADEEYYRQISPTFESYPQDYNDYNRRNGPMRRPQPGAGRAGPKNPGAAFYPYGNYNYGFANQQPAYGAGAGTGFNGPVPNRGAGPKKYDQQQGGLSGQSPQGAQQGSQQGAQQGSQQGTQSPTSGAQVATQVPPQQSLGQSYGQKPSQPQGVPKQVGGYNAMTGMPQQPQPQMQSGNMGGVGYNKPKQGGYYPQNAGVPAPNAAGMMAPQGGIMGGTGKAKGYNMHQQQYQQYQHPAPYFMPYFGSYQRYPAPHGYYYPENYAAGTGFPEDGRYAMGAEMVGFEGGLASGVSKDMTQTGAAQSYDWSQQQGATQQVAQQQVAQQQVAQQQTPQQQHIAPVSQPKDTKPQQPSAMAGAYVGKAGQGLGMQQHPQQPPQTQAPHFGSYYQYQYYQ